MESKEHITTAEPGVEQIVYESKDKKVVANEGLYSIVLSRNPETGSINLWATSRPGNNIVKSGNTLRKCVLTVSYQNPEGLKFEQFPQMLYYYTQLIIEPSRFKCTTLINVLLAYCYRNCCIFKDNTQQLWFFRFYGKHKSPRNPPGVQLVSRLTLRGLSKQSTPEEIPLVTLDSPTHTTLTSPSNQEKMGEVSPSEAQIEANDTNSNKAVCGSEFDAISIHSLPPMALDSSSDYQKYDRSTDMNMTNFSANSTISDKDYTHSKTSTTDQSNYSTHFNTIFPSAEQPTQATYSSDKPSPIQPPSLVDEYATYYPSATFSPMTSSIEHQRNLAPSHIGEHTQSIDYNFNKIDSTASIREYTSRYLRQLSLEAPKNNPLNEYYTLTNDSIRKRLTTSRSTNYQNEEYNYTTLENNYYQENQYIPPIHNTSTTKQPHNPHINLPRLKSIFSCPGDESDMIYRNEYVLDADHKHLTTTVPSTDTFKSSRFNNFPQLDRSYTNPREDLISYDYQDRNKLFDPYLKQEGNYTYYFEPDKNDLELRTSTNISSTPDYRNYNNTSDLLAHLKDSLQIENLLSKNDSIPNTHNTHMMHTNSLQAKPTTINLTQSNNTKYNNNQKNHPINQAYELQFMNRDTQKISPGLDTNITTNMRRLISTPSSLYNQQFFDNLDRDIFDNKHFYNENFDNNYKKMEFDFFNNPHKANYTEKYLNNRDHLHHDSYKYNSLNNINNNYSRDYTRLTSVPLIEQNFLQNFRNITLDRSPQVMNNVFDQSYEKFSSSNRNTSNNKHTKNEIRNTFHLGLNMVTPSVVD